MRPREKRLLFFNFLVISFNTDAVTLFVPSQGHVMLSSPTSNSLRSSRCIWLNSSLFQGRKISKFFSLGVFLWKPFPLLIRKHLNSHQFSCDLWNVLVELQLLNLLLRTGFFLPRINKEANCLQLLLPLL